jgi:hypothetical protein
MEELDAGQCPDDLMLRDPGPGACPCPEPLAKAARPATPCTIMQLTSRTCRWPLWGKERLPVEKRYYCGEAVAAGVYCAVHCKLRTSGRKTAVRQRRKPGTALRRDSREDAIPAAEPQTIH